MSQNMFCYQCQETAGCTGCTNSGVCGKTPEVAAMQDLLVYVTRGISAVTTHLRSLGTEISAEINHLITVNLFTTITNANFDKEMIVARIRETLDTKENLLKQCPDTSMLPAAALWNGEEHTFAVKAALVGVLSTKDEDIRSLREMITYGLKGLSAYSKHANALLKENAELDAFLEVGEQDEVWRDFFQTELMTGLRRGEICGLQWNDFDEDTGTLKVCR